MKNNKRGNILGILLIIGGIFLLLLFGFLIVIGSAVMNWVGDEVVPELTGIGMVGSSNISQTMDYTAVPVNNFIQNFTWMTGLLFIFGIIGIFGIAFVFKATGEKWMMGLYVALVLLLVIASIFISNIYQEFYDDGSELGDLLHEHTMISYLILYSPMIMGLIAFLAGIIIFGGEGGENI